MTQPLVPVPPELASRLAGTPLLVLLDVDGTLAPIAPRPSDAAVPPETRDAVRALRDCPGVTVAIVSGRAAADATRIVGVRDIWVIGNHGFELVRPDGETVPDEQLEDFEGAIVAAARSLAIQLAGLPGVLVEDKGWTLTVHYRLAERSIVPHVIETAERTAEALGLRVMKGKEVVELRPPSNVDKGTAAVRLADLLGGVSAWAGIIYIGDDATDEDAFAVLRQRVPGAVTVHVAHGEGRTTAAAYVLNDTDAVRSFLEWLVARRRQ